MKLHIDKRKKLTKPFFPWKRSNFFYKHFCIEKWRKKVLIKKQVFSRTKGLRNSKDNIEGYLPCKKLRNRQGGSRDIAPFVIRACPGSTWATPGADRRRDKNENFFWSIPNDPIRKVNRLKSIFEHLSKISPTTGWSQPSLRNFSRKIWKHDHQKLGRSSSLYSYTMMNGWYIWCFYYYRGRSVKCGGFCICDVSTSLLLVNCECILTDWKCIQLSWYPFAHACKFLECFAFRKYIMVSREL